MRLGRIQRTTSETEISCTLQVDGDGIADVETGCGFLDHMLTLFARHGRFDLTLSCRGDVLVDYHHTVEDASIVLGRAFSQALGDRAGICRYGSVFLPMDEALVLAALDISGRSVLQYDLAFPSEKMGEFDTELIREFFAAFSREVGMALHLRQFSGVSSHHIAEAAFKATARALAQAVDISEDDPDGIPSSKGTIL